MAPKVALLASAHPLAPLSRLDLAKLVGVDDVRFDGHEVVDL